MPPSRALRRDESESSNPLLRSLMWMLVGIGLVGLVLFGAQKFLFNRNAEPGAAPADTQAQSSPAPGSPAPPTPAPDTSAAKPSPVGEPRANDDTSKQAPKSEPPRATTPETTKSDSVPPEKARAAPPSEAPSDTSRDTVRDSPRREVSAIPSPVVARPAGGQSMQFLTDPPGAQITVDNNSSFSCKTPCLLSIPPGRHVLNVQLAGYRAYPRVFNVPQDGDSVFMQLTKFTASLSVTSTPPGATIEINGELQSQHTPARFNFPPGTYHVRVTRSGAFIDFDVQLHDGEFLSRNVSF
jgi:hypothetical protein